jgi:hypothetical protein
MPVRILQSKQLPTQGLTPQQGFESLQPVAKHLHQLRLSSQPMAKRNSFEFKCPSNLTKKHDNAAQVALHIKPYISDLTRVEMLPE